MAQVDEVERLCEVCWNAEAEHVGWPMERWDEANSRGRDVLRAGIRAVLSALFEGGDSRRRSAGEPVTEIV